ncbi:hypothetical protein K8353_35100, partial [Burkholderia contaminans]|nr:hypothetical protein [Burkholderia contaminans]
DSPSRMSSPVVSTFAFFAISLSVMYFFIYAGGAPRRQPTGRPAHIVRAGSATGVGQQRGCLPKAHLERRRFRGRAHARG